MELKTYLQILNRRKWIVILTVLATICGYFIAQAVSAPSYEATTELRVIPYSSGEPPYAQLVYANRIMNTYIEITTSGPFLEALRGELGLEKGRPEEVSADIVPDTELLIITVSDPDPYLARDAANSLAAMVISENPIRDINVTVVDPAILPEPGTLFQEIMNIFLALVVGVTAGTGLAFLVENLDPRLHSTEEIVEISGLSIIGQIPYNSQKGRIKPLIREFPYDDAFRRLRISLLNLSEKAEMKTLMLTSSQPEEGKSTISANLAISLAETGRRVLLVDADLHRPSLHNIFALPNETGLSNISQGIMPPSQAIQKTEITGLELLSSGSNLMEPSQLLDPRSIIPIFSELESEYDFILVNSPAYLGVVDAAMLIPAVNGVILVAKRGLVRDETLQATCTQLASNDANMIGLIVNNANPPLPKDYYNYYRKPVPPPIKPEEMQIGEAIPEVTASIEGDYQTAQPSSFSRRISNLGKVFTLRRTAKYAQESSQEKEYYQKPLELPARVIMLTGNSPCCEHSRIEFLAELLIDSGSVTRIITPYQSEFSQIQSSRDIPIHRYLSPPGRRFFWNLILAPVFSSFVLLWTWLRHGLDVLYVVNPPDTLVLAGLLPKLFRKTLLLDIREPLPELYSTEYHHSGGMRYKTTCWLERLGIRFAHHITVPNNTCQQLLVNRDRLPEEKVSVVFQGPDLIQIKQTEPDTNLRSKAGTILVYQSNGSTQHGAENLINALYFLENSYSFKDWFCLLIGVSDHDEHLTALAEKLEIEDRLWFAGSQPVEKWAMLLSTADICIDPARNNALNSILTSQPIMNYMAVGKPIVAYDFPENRETAGDAAVYPQANNQVDLAEKILHLVKEPDLRKEMGEIGRKRIERQISTSSQDGFMDFLKRNFSQINSEKHEPINAN